jgi:corrinoid protein of di/trimethylamine methyltransferase
MINRSLSSPDHSVILVEKITSNKLRNAILAYDIEGATAAAREALGKGLDPVEVIECVLGPAMNEIGAKFEREEIFLPDMMMAADALQAAVQVLKQGIPAAKKYSPAKIVIGTIEGDVHDIGKNIVATMLEAAGYSVTDLGNDVPASNFVRRAVEEGTNVIAASALMTVTRPNLSRIRGWMKQLGVEERHKLIVGGGSVTMEYAENIGADGYAKNAVEAAQVIRKWLEVHSA